MKSLVTGADGFVGEHLLTHLLEKGDEVAASAIKLPPTRGTLTSAQMEAVDWKAADVRDPDALFRVLAAVEPEHVYHLAGFASGMLAREHSGEAMAINAGGTVNLCEAVLAVEEEFPGLDPRVLVAGSGEAYGDAGAPGEPLRESLTLRPTTVYGLTKACQELTAHTYRRSSGVRAVVTRSFNLVGPGQGEGFVVPDLCRRVAAIAAGEAEPLLEVPDLEHTKDFTDVRDAVRAFTEIMELEDPHAAYNVCSGEVVTVGEVAGWILDEAGIEAELTEGGELSARAGEPTSPGDPARLREDTGWEPLRTVEETVREIYRSMAS